MTVKELDFAFPFFVFVYGAIMFFVATHPALVRIAEERLPAEVWSRFQAKKHLGLFCIVIGGLWSLQNLWFQSL